MKNAITAVMMPPVRALIFAGARLARPNAAGMKLATRLMPTVAAKKVSAAMMVSARLSTLATISAGLVISSPNSTEAPAVMNSARKEKKARLTGRPRKLPHFICDSFLTKREKSP